MDVADEMDALNIKSGGVNAPGAEKKLSRLQILR